MKGMNNVITYIDNVLYVKQDAHNFVSRVRSRLERIFTEFIEIGKDLKLAQENKYYKELGFNTLEDLSSELFGIKKTVCYNLIKLYETCSDGEHILPEYKGYSQNQLIELISVKSAPDKFLEITKPEDSIRKIKEARKLWDEKNKDNTLTDVKSIDDLILKFSGRSENLEESKEKTIIEQKIQILKTIKDFLQKNNCVCFLAPKSRKQAKNNKFIESLEKYLGENYE